MIRRNRQLLTEANAEPQADQWLAITIARAIWDNVPLLLVIDAALAMAAFPVLLAAGFGAIYVAPLLAALLMAPIWLAAIHVASKLLDGDGVSTGAFLRDSRIGCGRHTRRDCAGSADVLDAGDAGTLWPQ